MLRLSRLVCLAAERRKQVAHGVSRGFAVFFAKSRQGRKSAAVNISPLPGLGSLASIPRLTPWAAFWRNSVARVTLRSSGSITVARNTLLALSLVFGLQSSSVSAPVSGNKSALVMLVSMTNAPIDCTVGEVNGMVFTNLPLNVDSFYNDATWGGVRWTGSVVNVSINYGTTPCNADVWANAADAQAVLQGYNPSAYTARVYALPSAAGSCGYAFASGNRVWNFHCSDLFAYGHEMGHSLGLGHASTDRNNDGVLEDAYGGYDDCMGGESYTFNAPHKIWGGWLPQKASNGGWRVVDANGTYQISPLQINPVSNPPHSQALKIIPPTGIPYFLSYRQPLGFDQGWTATQVGKDGRSGTSFDPTPSIAIYPYSRGVTIHRHSGATGAETLEIAVIEDNQQFLIPGTGIVIKQNSHNATSASVNISGFGGGTIPTGVTFFQDANYQGAQSQVLTAGNYTLTQLIAKGVFNDWATSIKVPSGWTAIFYQHDNFDGTSWTVTSDVANLTSLVPPGANDQVSSCQIIAGPVVAPAVPMQLSAAASNAAVRLSWTATPGATSYFVKRATSSGGPYTTNGTPTFSAFTDVSVTNGTIYYYVVTAVNAAGVSGNSAQVSAAPVNDLVAHWKFDETAGVTAADSSGNINPGTLNNNPSRIIPGKVGPAALAFNAASSQWVTAASSASLNSPLNAITIAAWIYPNDWSGNRRILQKGNSDNQYRLLAENGVLKFHLSGVDQVTAPLPPVAVWTHVAAVWDGGTMSLFINGAALTNRSAAGLINTTSDLLYIATKNSSAPSGDRFNGRLDDVRVYNRALNPVEVAAIMTNAPPAFVSNPFSKPDANAGQLYAGSIAANAADPEKDPLTFAKLSGPAWLSVASNGALSGTPFSPQAGLNSFSVRATDSSGAFSVATMNLTVIPAPVIDASIATQGDNLLLTWTGGLAPYQVQVATNLPPFEWYNFGSTTGGTSLLIAPTNSAAFYRILGQ